ncbi:hypothetical protein, partial [Pseudomonas aeruginosa]|uniref:hypothetical protein n=1 Tax=Pseudomonas aeruginosa TaxID=287 RepID=UPI0015737E40
MKVMKWSAIALAVSAGSTQFAVADAFVSDQAEAKGFIEDSSPMSSTLEIIHKYHIISAQISAWEKPF